MSSAAPNPLPRHRVASIPVQVKDPASGAEQDCVMYMCINPRAAATAFEGRAKVAVCAVPIPVTTKTPVWTCSVQPESAALAAIQRLRWRRRVLARAHGRASLPEAGDFEPRDGAASRSRSRSHSQAHRRPARDRVAAGDTIIRCALSADALAQELWKLGVEGDGAESAVEGLRGLDERRPLLFVASACSTRAFARDGAGFAVVVPRWSDPTPLSFFQPVAPAGGKAAAEVTALFTRSMIPDSVVEDEMKMGTASAIDLDSLCVDRATLTSASTALSADTIVRDGLGWIDSFPDLSIGNVTLAGTFNVSRFSASETRFSEGAAALEDESVCEPWDGPPSRWGAASLGASAQSADSVAAAVPRLSEATWVGGEEDALGVKAVAVAAYWAVPNACTLPDRAKPSRENDFTAFDKFSTAARSLSSFMTVSSFAAPAGAGSGGGSRAFPARIDPTVVGAHIGSVRGLSPGEALALADVSARWAGGVRGRVLARLPLAHVVAPERPLSGAFSHLWSFYAAGDGDDGDDCGHHGDPALPDESEFAFSARPGKRSAGGAARGWRRGGEGGKGHGEWLRDDGAAWPPIGERRPVSAEEVHAECFLVSSDAARDDRFRVMGEPVGWERRSAAAEFASAPPTLDVLMAPVRAETQRATARAATSAKPPRSPCSAGGGEASRGPRRTRQLSWLSRK